MSYDQFALKEASYGKAARGDRRPLVEEIYSTGGSKGERTKGQVTRGRHGLVHAKSGPIRDALHRNQLINLTGFPDTFPYYEGTSENLYAKCSKDSRGMPDALDFSGPSVATQIRPMMATSKPANEN